LDGQAISSFAGADVDTAGQSIHHEQLESFFSRGEAGAARIAVTGKGSDLP
jgi:hypothetical protein